MPATMTLIGRTLILGSSIAATAAQAQDRDSFPVRAIGYDVATPLSPSSATSTVSPSSVPQAMERMGDDALLDLSLGTIYAEGKFGTATNTYISSSAIGARVRVGDWKLSASLPYMSIRSRSTFFTGIDATPVLVALDTSPTKRTADGFGDLTLGAAYTIAPPRMADRG